MQIEDRDDFLRDLAEKIQEINTLFEDNGIDPPSMDCDTEECSLPDDHDIVTLRNLFSEANVLLDDYII